jgi:S-disulfanyl-L-cysteine oxidoreductase SoxD
VQFGSFGIGRACGVVLTVASAASLLAAAGVNAQTTERRSIRDGVFSAAQVERGRESFLWRCMDCHEMEEFTGVGAYFEKVENQGKTLWEVFEYIWSEMPEDSPAWLEPAEYADILAYMLSVYGLPTGASDMPTNRAALDRVMIEGPSLPGS